MSIQQEIKLSIANLQSSFTGTNFEPFINYIRFPNFKNLEKDERISFDFPFTVFTGLNGSGKSSALHALYGAPFDKSTSDFWFNTKIDPISDETGNPNCFIYGYKNPSPVEVLKQRTGIAKGSDYWEPQPPTKKYAMIGSAGKGVKKRTPPIKKKLIYLDFRAELSAFDKYFYFSKFNPTKTFTSKQDVLRNYSKYIKNNILKTGVRELARRKVRSQIQLNTEALNAVCNILGKKYTECRILFHNFYGIDGVTVYFTTNNLKYSEAYAGRGEFAVVKLVYEVLNAPQNSLVILDEPEVSLHPGAQDALKLFLLRQTLIKKLQVIISTHSSKIVEFLPDKAIKLFYENSNSKFSVKNNCNYIEAFHNIGLEINENNKSVIIVEDTSAQLLVSSILKSLGNEYDLLFIVKYFPGGAEQMYKNAARYSEEKEIHKFVLLDGDKNKPIFNPNEFTVEESSDFSFLDSKLLEETGIAFKNLGFRIDGGQTGGNATQKIQSSINFFKFLQTNLAYLPKVIPEEIIWDATFATGLLAVLKKTAPLFTSDIKNNIKEFALSQFGDYTSSSISSVKKQLIDNFIEKKNEDYESIKSIIEKFKLATESV